MLIICILHNFEMRLYECTKPFFTFLCFILSRVYNLVAKENCSCTRGQKKAPENVILVFKKIILSSDQVDVSKVFTICIKHEATS